MSDTDQTPASTESTTEQDPDMAPSEAETDDSLVSGADDEDGLSQAPSGHDDEFLSTYGETWGFLHYMYLPIVLGGAIGAFYLWFDMFFLGSIVPEFSFAFVFWPLVGLAFMVASFLSFRTARWGLSGRPVASTQTFRTLMLFHAAILLFAVFSYGSFWGLIIVEAPYVLTGSLALNS